MSGPADSIGARSPEPPDGEVVARGHTGTPGAQEFLAQRRERLIAEQRAQNLSKGLMFAFGAIVFGAVVTFLVMSGGDGEVAQESGDAPASLAFDGLGEPGDINDPNFDPHAGHDHAAVVARPHYSDDYGLTQLRGDVPVIIQQNFQLPDDSQVIHVIVQTEGVWEFEGLYPDGERFWKIIDLNQSLIYDGGSEPLAEAFPRVFN